MIENSKTRFSNRVDDYVAYRPGYPEAIVGFLEGEFGLRNEDVIADIGSGTGISSAMFLAKGCRVTGVEPNGEMREKSVELLKSYPRFTAVDGTAEHTGLPGGSVDVIVAGQAFHWFERDKARVEFARILKPDALVVLIWNERLAVSPFEVEYDRLIVRHGKDYIKVDHRNVDLKSISDFFAPHEVTEKVFLNHQDFDFEGLKGRLLSSSYVPARDEPGYMEMIADLKELFDRHEQNGGIRIQYDTKVFAGRWG